MEATNQRSIALMYGLLTALILVAYTTVLYLGGVDMFLGPIAYLGYVVMITMATLAALKQKKINGGYLEFQDALKTTFTVLVIALLVQSIFTYILLTFIDHDFKTVLAQASMEKAEAVLKKFGLAQNEIDKAMDKERAKDPFSAGRVLLGFAFSCIVQFILAMIIAAIVKKKRPEFLAS